MYMYMYTCTCTMYITHCVLAEHVLYNIHVVMCPEEGRTDK